MALVVVFQVITGTVKNVKFAEMRIVIALVIMNVALVRVRMLSLVQIILVICVSNAKKMMPLNAASWQKIVEEDNLNILLCQLNALLVQSYLAMLVLSIHQHISAKHLLVMEDAKHACQDII